jgi:transcriptional regulator with XRE-family HTH domain
MNDALRLLRVFHDIKSKDLAKKLGISTSYLSEIEKGRKDITLKIIKKYASVFNTTPSAIMLIIENSNSNDKSIKKYIKKKMIEFLQKVEHVGK